VSQPYRPKVCPTPSSHQKEPPHDGRATWRIACLAGRLRERGDVVHEQADGAENMRHALKRTSPKGGPFIGACINCGKVNIALASREECKNWTNRTADETLLHIIRNGQ
jgi:hypothetical protein